jgi:hypothetical protein
MLQRRFAICVESSLRSAMMRFLRSFAFEGRGLGLYFRPWRAENWRRLAFSAARWILLHYYRNWPLSPSV